MPALLAIVAAILLMGQAIAGPAEPVTLIDPAEPMDSTITAIHEPAEDEPGWNCLTMGNRSCGEGWEPADPEWTTEPDGTTHEGCLVLIGDTSYIACPDGYTTTS